MYTALLATVTRMQSSIQYCLPYLYIFLKVIEGPIL